MPMYYSLRSYVSRLHDVLGRKKNKPLVISEPFGFKKEDGLSQLPGVPNAELHMLREKAAASIVGSAIAIRTYASTGDLADLVDLHGPPPYEGGGGGGGYSRASSSLSSSPSSSPPTPTATTDGFGLGRPPLRHHHSCTLRHKGSSVGSSSGSSSFAEAPPGAHPALGSSGSAAVALTSHPTRTYSNATTASRSSSSTGSASAALPPLGASSNKHRIPRVAIGRSTATATMGLGCGGPASPGLRPPTVTAPGTLQPTASSSAPFSPASSSPLPSPSLSAVPQRLLARNNRQLPKPKSLPTLRVELASTEPYAPSGLSAPPALVRASSMGSVREQR